MYRTLNQHYRETFGCKVYKLSLDGGFSCPNRDGKCGTGGCIFCGERGSGEHITPALSIENQVSSVISQAAKDDLFIAYFQNFTNTYMPTDIFEKYKEENIKMRDHDPEELSHYSKGTTDIEFLFPFGWGELWGIADRTDYDLGQHQEHSGKDMTYFDPETNEHYIPYVVEPSLGADRVALAFLVDAYDEEEISEGDVRTVLHLHPALAPVKAAILPLSKKLSEKALELYDELAKEFPVDFDETGSIGKRYRREDEIGTPYCITYDFETENDGCVTVRDRDTMEQVRIPLAEVKSYIAEKIVFESGKSVARAKHGCRRIVIVRNKICFDLYSVVVLLSLSSAFFFSSSVISLSSFFAPLFLGEVFFFFSAFSVIRTFTSNISILPLLV